jgi:uncharacterized protein YkwD
MSPTRKAILSVAVVAAGLVVAACPISNPGGGGTTVTQEILTMEEETFDLVNAERTNGGLAALTMNTNLRNLARNHSQDMASRDVLSHYSANGDDPFDRMAAAGITYTSAAENIADNYGHADPAQTAVTGWMGSAPHQANILTAGFTKTGVGIAVTGGGTYYFTQVFTEGYKLGEPVYVIEGYWVDADGVPVE